MVRYIVGLLLPLLGTASGVTCSELQTAYRNFLNAEFTVTRTAHLTVDGKTAFRQSTALQVQGKKVSSRVLSREESGASVNFKDTEPFPPVFACDQIRQVKGELYQVRQPVTDLKGGEQVAQFTYQPERQWLVPLEITETGVASILFFRKQIAFKVVFQNLRMN